MKKGRHRRYEEARKAKRGIPVPLTRCDECGGDAVHGHATWCMAHVAEEDLDTGRGRAGGGEEG